MLAREHDPLFRGEPRYDGEALRKVTALAQRLERERHDTLSAREIEEIGAEVGLDPAFIRTAIAQVHTAARVPQRQEPRASRHALPAEESRTGPLVPVPLQVSVYWAVLAAILGDQNGAGFSAPFFYALAPLPVAFINGFASADKKLSKLAGAFLVAALALGMFATSPPHDNLLRMLASYLLIGAPLAAGAGWLGAAFRGKLFPRRQEPAPLSRGAVLELVFALERQLESQKQHRAFLSIGISGASEMKRGDSELAVEYSFGRFREWAETECARSGGMLLGAGADGMTYHFTQDAHALRAARRLQDGIAYFNGEHNRLAVPFRLRCGVSAGLVAVEPGAPLDRVPSPVIDRAVILQKSADPGDILVGGELASAGLQELGSLTGLPEAPGGEPAFSWRGAVRAVPA